MFLSIIREANQIIFIHSTANRSNQLFCFGFNKYVHLENLVQIWFLKYFTSFYCEHKGKSDFFKWSNKAIIKIKCNKWLRQHTHSRSIVELPLHSIHNKHQTLLFPLKKQVENCFIYKQKQARCFHGKFVNVINTYQKKYNSKCFYIVDCTSHTYTYAHLHTAHTNNILIIFISKIAFTTNSFKIGCSTLLHKGTGKLKYDAKQTIQWQKKSIFRMKKRNMEQHKIQQLIYCFFCFFPVASFLFCCSSLSIVHSGLVAYVSLNKKPIYFMCW